MEPATHCDSPPASAGAPPRIGRAFWRRARGAAVLAACASMLLCGAMLHPRAEGTGTHQDLGLAGCSALQRTGWPCPTCGLTTSVAATLHGRLALAWTAQPFGILLTAAAIVLAAAGLLELLTAANLLGRLRWRRLLAGAVCGLLAGWAFVLYSGACSGRFPTH